MLAVLRKQYYEYVMHAFTMKKPQSWHALPSWWMVLDRWLGVPEVSREKSMMGIDSSGSSETVSSLGLRVKVYLGGMEVRPGVSASGLTLTIFGTLMNRRCLWGLACRLVGFNNMVHDWWLRAISLLLHNERQHHIWWEKDLSNLKGPEDI